MDLETSGATLRFEAFERGKHHGYQQATCEFDERRETNLWWGTFFGASVLVILGSYMNYVAFQAESHAQALHTQLEAMTNARNDEIANAKAMSKQLGAALDTVCAAAAKVEDELRALKRRSTKSKWALTSQQYSLRALGDRAHCELIRGNAIEQEIQKLVWDGRCLRFGCIAMCVALCGSLLYNSVTTHRRD